MSVIARILSRGRQVHRATETPVEILIIFCLSGLVLSLLAVRYGVDPTVGLSAIADVQ